MRQRHGRVFSRFCVGLVLAVALLAVSAGSAGAKNTKPKHNTCTGTTDNFPTELGTLSGTYSGHVKISGACAVDAGPTTINGNLTIGKGSTLIAVSREPNMGCRGKSGPTRSRQSHANPQ